MKRSKDLMLFGAEPTEHIFKGLWLFLLVYLGASVFAAVMTPLSYWLVEWVNSVSPCELTQYLLKKRVDIFYDRLRYAPIVVALPFVLHKCGLLSFRNLGISFDAASLKIFAKFWLAGAACVLFIFAIQAYFLGIKPDEERSISSCLVMPVLGGLTLGFLEETIFRGFILRGLYSAFETLSAVVLCSLFFAYKHFKVPSSIWNVMPDGGHSAAWDSGFVVFYYDTVGIMQNFSLIVFLSLFAFGCILCVFYLKQKSLNAPIGFHAGAVTFMLSLKNTFDYATRNDSLFGDASITNGVVGFAVMIAVLAFAIFAMKQSDKSLS